MILTLTKDVARLGKIGDRVRVSDAYARNVLVPQKIAVVGEQTLFRASARPKESLDHKAVKVKLKGVFQLKRKSNEKGGLYEKISNQTVEELIAKKLQVSAQMVSCKLDEPLHSLGTYDVVCRIDSKEYSIHVTIEKE